jgi:uncharacterized repeat protein (TIGR01451 family)
MLLQKILCRFLLVVSLITAINQITLAQIPSYLPTDSLVAWWPFNTNGNDESGNGHNGIVTGAMPTFDRAGNPNEAYFFNGVEDLIQVAHHPDLNSLPISFSWWMKPQTNDDGGQVFTKYANATWNGYTIQYWPNSIPAAQWEVAYRANFSYGVYQTYDTPLPQYDWASDPGLFDDNWHHYAFVVDSLNGTFYKDGNVLAVYPWWYGGGTGTPSAVTGPWNLILGQGVRGMLDDMAIWKTALTSQQVSDLYNASNNICQATIRVFNDINANCASDDQQLGLPGQFISVEPGGYGFLTDITGSVFLCGLPDGDYVATIDTTNSGWITNCPASQAISIVNGEMSPVEFALISDDPCGIPNVTIISPTIRRCSEHTWPIYIHVCNDYMATGGYNDGNVLVDLDENIIVDPLTSPPFTIESDGRYRFIVGAIAPGDCFTIVINANFSCDLELGETICMEATLTPVPECLQDTVPVPGPCELPWDQSSLSVNGWCDPSTDSVYFTVSNGGEAMDCFSQVRVYFNGELLYTYYIQLNAESDTTFAFPSGGGTWILQADQHPLHPGNSHPNDHVEGCGGDGDWTPGLVDDLPCGDESPFVDVYCGEVVGSFDPNDKQGFPNGVGETHDILPNEQLQYLIRFQNTGTAPAYTVVIRDTLDTDLDIFSVTPGVASHDYSFTMFGERVLQWTFNNIMLADSFSNEEASHGFITYTVDQVADLTDGSQITNNAAIYFDSNEPVITNTTLHTINHCLFQEDQLEIDTTAYDVYTAPDGAQYTESGDYTAVLTNAIGCDSTITIHLTVLVGVLEMDAPGIHVFPIPASQTITALWNADAANYVVTTPDGRTVITGRLNGGTNTIDISTLATGNYFLKADNRVTRFVVK